MSSNHLTCLIRFKNYTLHVDLLTRIIICINISDNFDHRIIMEDGLIPLFLLHGPSWVPLRQRYRVPLLEALSGTGSFP